MRFKQQRKSIILPVALASGLVLASAGQAWGAEVTTAVTATHEVSVPVEESSIPLIDDRVLAIGLGVLGGIATYQLIAGGGWGAGAARMARLNIPGSVLRTGGAAWGGRWFLTTVSGVLGALVGDWIYRSNEQPK
jgi:hypothetical protein